MQEIQVATLSVIVITKNEAESIGTCLQSVSWAHEVIVVDSGSTDNTVTICRDYTDKIFVTDWPGFGAQKIGRSIWLPGSGYFHWTRTSTLQLNYKMRYKRQ